MMNLTVEGDKEVVATFEQLGPEFTRAAQVGLQQAALAVAGSAQNDFIRKQGEVIGTKGNGDPQYGALGPPVEGILTSRTGELRSSISIADAGQLSVAIGPTVVYGAIHEFGGTIVPVRAERLKFRLFDGTFIATKKVEMPPRPYLRPALKKQKPVVVSIIREKLAAAVAAVIQRTGAMRVK